MIKFPLFEDVFNDLDGKEIIASSQVMTTQQSSSDGLSAYDMYFIFEFQTIRRRDDYSNSERIVFLNGLFEKFKAIIDEFDLADKMYFDLPVIKSINYKFDKFQVQEPVPNKLSINELYRNTKQSWYDTMHNDIAIDFYVYFNKSKLVEKTYEEWVKSVLKMSANLSACFYRISYGSIDAMKFYKNERTEKQIKKFENPVENQIAENISINYPIVNSGFDALYAALYGEDKIPTDNDCYERDGKRNYYKNSVVYKMGKMMPRVIETGIELAKKHFGINLSLEASGKPFTVKATWSDTVKMMYIILNLHPGSKTVTSDELEDCIHSCFSNRMPLIAYNVIKFVIAVRPVGCEIDNVSPLTGKKRMHERKLFENSPVEMKCKNIEYRVSGTKKLYQSYRDGDTQVDDKGRYYKTVSNDTNKMCEKIRTAEYSHYATNPNGWLIFLDKKGMVMRNVKKCRFYGEAVLEYMLTHILPVHFNYTLKDD